ncbi:MAG TPA: SDR family oxidoreductase [Rhodoferax sp.]|nr:SDR family oxidoreductase [Rhodoferax sp.]
MKSKILVTGGVGFVGRALCQKVASQDFDLMVAVRVESPSIQSGSNVCIPSLDEQTDWSLALFEVDAVIHLAARVHVMHEVSKDPLTAFRKTNVLGTLNLARQAAAAGVRRFVFISSVKVNGEETHSLRPFCENDLPAPQDPYAVSKWEAEQGLRAIAADTGMEVVIIRPPLVYGPGVRANFSALLRAVSIGLPLPLGAIQNQRSLIALDNLVDFIVTCTTHANAANQTFLISDGEDLSTPELICRIAHALNKKPHLFSMPIWSLNAFARLLGKRNALQRLSGNLQVDISKARSFLDWVPPISVDEGLRRTVAVPQNP